jgi:ribosomal protein L31
MLFKLNFFNTLTNYYQTVENSYVEISSEPHPFYAILAPGKNIDAATPSAAPAQQYRLRAMAMGICSDNQIE